MKLWVVTAEQNSAPDVFSGKTLATAQKVMQIDYGTVNNRIHK